MLYRAYEGLEDCHGPSPMAPSASHILPEPQNPGDNPPPFITGPKGGRGYPHPKAGDRQCPALEGSVKMLPWDRWDGPCPDIVTADPMDGYIQPFCLCFALLLGA